MNPYSEILSVMRNEGKKDNPASLRLGIMQDAASCIAGDLLLSGDDLLVAEHLKTGYHYAVDNTVPSLKNDSTFIEPLKEGDTVIIYRLSDEKYVILERVVEL